MYKFKIKLYNEQVFKLILPLAKFVMVEARLVSNGFCFFLSYIPVDIQLVTFFCYLILVS